MHWNDDPEILKVHESESTSWNNPLGVQPLILIRRLTMTYSSAYNDEPFTIKPNQSISENPPPSKSIISKYEVKMPDGTVQMFSPGETVGFDEDYAVRRSTGEYEKFQESLSPYIWLKPIYTTGYSIQLNAEPGKFSNSSDGKNIFIMQTETFGNYLTN